MKPQAEPRTFLIGAHSKRPVLAKDVWIVQVPADFKAEATEQKLVDASSYDAAVELLREQWKQTWGDEELEPDEVPPEWLAVYTFLTAQEKP